MPESAPIAGIIDTGIPPPLSSQLIAETACTCHSKSTRPPLRIVVRAVAKLMIGGVSVKVIVLIGLMLLLKLVSRRAVFEGARFTTARNWPVPRRFGISALITILRDCAANPAV